MASNVFGANISSQYLRMKNHMNAHVDNNRAEMFTKSTEEVKIRLVQMCRDVEERMANKAEELWLAMNRDYTQVVSGSKLPQGQQMPKWERQLRSEIGQIIEERARSIEAAEKEAERDAEEIKGEAEKEAAKEVDTSAVANETTSVKDEPVSDAAQPAVAGPKSSADADAMDTA